MRAVTIVSGELRLVEHADPVAGDTELLVAVHAAGVNAADLMQRDGFYPAPAGVPADIPGLELAGEVRAVGRRVTRFVPGDKVMALVGGGAQAEMALVDETCAMTVPDGLSCAAAGGFAEAYSTAYDALFLQCGLRLGDRVLVTGAAGGVGSAAVQLAAAAGAHVVASVRRPELHDSVRALGAAEVDEPDGALGRGPYDIALELVGGVGVTSLVRAMAIGGRISVIGVGAGARVELDLLSLMRGRVTIRGSTLRARSLIDKGAVARAVQSHVVPLLASGRVRVPVAATFPMANAVDAYTRFAAGGTFGKIVLVGDGDGEGGP